MKPTEDKEALLTASIIPQGALCTNCIRYTCNFKHVICAEQRLIIKKILLELERLGYVRPDKWERRPILEKQQRDVIGTDLEGNPLKPLVLYHKD